MDPVRNPFAPSAGSRPPELAGRQEILEMARVACARATLGRHPRPLMLLGLRGTGKTVLLNEIKRIAEAEGLIASRVEAPESGRLAGLILPEMRKVLRSLSGIEAARHLATRGLRGLRNFASAFKVNLGDIGVGIERASDPEPGLADSGRIDHDLPELFGEIGAAAQAAGRGWALLIDEVQYLDAEDLSALIVALHRVSQDRHPIAFAGAGLPQIARLAGDAKSYAERLFAFPDVGALTAQAAADAIRLPVEAEGAALVEGAVDLIVRDTQGYPFFIQEWGARAWDIAAGPEITAAEAAQAYPLALASLDGGFFRVRMDRLTRAETEFVAAMAELGDGPYPIAEIARAMGRKPSSLGPARAAIIHKGMIYSTDHGLLDFTVPLFADFMRRQRAAPAQETP